MTRSRVVFRAPSEMFAFLTRTIGEDASSRWPELDAARVRVVWTGECWIAAETSWIQKYTRLARGARHDPAPGSAAAGLAATEIHRRIRLTRAAADAACSRYLVLPPKGADAPAIAALTDALALLRDFDVDAWPAKTVRGGDIHVFRLSAARGGAVPPPSFLPAAPSVLADWSGQHAYTPLHLEHPLARRLPELLPPDRERRPLLWMPGPAGAIAVDAITERAPADRLISIVDLTLDAVSVTAVAHKIKAKVDVRLEVVAGRAATRGDGIARSAYRLVSRWGHFGEDLLRLLDHSEAGLLDLQYHNRPLDPTSAFSRVEHFFLERSGPTVAELGAWQTLERFDLPVAFDDVDLPIYVSHRARIRPDLIGLVRGLTATDAVVVQLRRMCGIDGTEGVVALLEATDEPRKPRITLLKDGKPVLDVVAPLLRTWDKARDPDAAYALLPDMLEAEREELRNAWRAAADADAAAIAEATKELHARLDEAAERIEKDIRDLDARLDACEAVSESAQATVMRAPDDLDDFIGRVRDLVQLVSAPKREWLMSVQKRRDKLRAFAELVEQAATDVGAAAKQTHAALAERTTALERHRVELTAAIVETDARHATLAQETRTLQDVSARAESVLAARRESVGAAAADAGLRLRRADDAAARLIEEQAGVTALEARVTDQESANAALDRSNRDRLAAAQHRVERAEAERVRLARIRDEQIPAIETTVREADARVRELTSERVEQRYRKLIEESRRLRERREELERLVARCETLRKTLDDEAAGLAAEEPTAKAWDMACRAALARPGAHPGPVRRAARRWWWPFGRRGSESAHDE